MLIRMKLTADSISPPQFRYDPATNQAQYTSDGGATWQENLGIDPRHNTAYQFPPRGAPSDTTRCDAAANLVAALKAVIDILIAAPGVVAAINSWLQYVVRFMPEIGFIIQILTYIYDLLATLKPYLTGAFTSEVYDGIECFMYNHMDASGVLTSDGIGSLISDICGTYGETVCTVCQAILQTWWSSVGCSNAAAIGSLTGDCTSCPSDPVCVDTYGNAGGYSEWFEIVPGYCSPPLNPACMEFLEDGLQCTAASGTMAYRWNWTAAPDGFGFPAPSVNGWVVQINGTAGGGYWNVYSGVDGASATIVSTTPNEDITIPADYEFAAIVISCSAGKITSICVQRAPV